MSCCLCENFVISIELLGKWDVGYVLIAEFVSLQWDLACNVKCID
jgi:hypothetical protein